MKIALKCAQLRFQNQGKEPRRIGVRVGDKSQVKAVCCISFRGIVALATMRHLCEELASELKGGSWEPYFLRIVSQLQKYKEALEEGMEIPLSSDMIQGFEGLTNALRQLPNIGAPVSGMRVSQKVVDSLVSLSCLFDDPRSCLPWNGQRIVEALADFKSFGDRTPSFGGRRLVSYEALADNLKLLETAFRMAVIQMRKELDRVP